MMPALGEKQHSEWKVKDRMRLRCSWTALAVAALDCNARNGR
jgi:hypothetical protein